MILKLLSYDTVEYWLFPYLLLSNVVVAGDDPGHDLRLAQQLVPILVQIVIEPKRKSCQMSIINKKMVKLIIVSEQ